MMTRTRPPGVSVQPEVVASAGSASAANRMGVRANIRMFMGGRWNENMVASSPIVLACGCTVFRTGATAIRMDSIPWLVVKTNGHCYFAQSCYLHIHDHSQDAEQGAGFSERAIPACHARNERRAFCPVGGLYLCAFR